MLSPVVTVTGGQLKGSQMTNLDGEQFYAFLGIPFGKSPVAELRFKAPEPAEPWVGIKDSTIDGDPCCQRNFYTQLIEGSEDCLHLSVFTKNLPYESHELKPVLAWIHGGGFTGDSNSIKMYGPEFLLMQDIVLVTINYRLGFLGFLQLDDTSLDVPGNAGLKDQQLALKWIQNNIESFSGDPGNVTIFGESAGSASVHYHIMSPSSNGLFHKAILQSGCLLNYWSSADNYSMQFVKSIKGTVKTEREALEILRAVPADQLFAAQEHFCDSLGKSRMIGPNVEKPNKTAVITVSPTELLALGQFNKVPILIGYCDKEGLLMEFYKKPTVPPEKKRNDRFAKIGIENLIPPNVNRDDPKCKLVLKKITDTYLQGTHAFDKYTLITDYFMVPGIIASAKLHAKSSIHPVFLFRVTIDAGMNLKRIAGITEEDFVFVEKLVARDADFSIPSGHVDKQIQMVLAVHNPEVYCIPLFHAFGATVHLHTARKKTRPGLKKSTCHGDDLGYLFNVPLATDFLQKGETEEIAIKRFVKLWTNFAKTGNPTPEGNDLNVTWKAFDEKKLHFLDIGTKLTLQTDPESERMKVWKEIYQLSPETACFL